MKKLLALIKQVLGIAKTVKETPITTTTAPAVIEKIEEKVKEVTTPAKPKGKITPIEEAPKAPAKKKKKYYKPKQPKA